MLRHTTPWLLTLPPRLQFRHLKTCRSRRRAIIMWLGNARHCGSSDVVNKASQDHNLAVTRSDPNPVDLSKYLIQSALYSKKPLIKHFSAVINAVWISISDPFDFFRNPIRSGSGYELQNPVGSRSENQIMFNTGVGWGLGQCSQTFLFHHPLFTRCMSFSPPSLIKQPQGNEFKEVYFTSSRCKVRCSDESSGTRYDGQKTEVTSFSRDAKINTTAGSPQAVNIVGLAKNEVVVSYTTFPVFSKVTVWFQEKIHGSFQTDPRPALAGAGSNARPRRGAPLSTGVITSSCSVYRAMTFLMKLF